MKRSVIERKLQKVERALDKAIEKQEIPGAVVLARMPREGEILDYAWVRGHAVARPERLPMRRDTIFDLASLTKVLCTTTLAAIAVSEGKVGLDHEVPAPWSAAWGEGPRATLGDLLAHSGGLAAHREYFAELGRRGPGERVLGLVTATPLAYPVGAQAVYSDLGFMILGAWLERLFDAPIDRAFADRVAWPLGLDAGVVPRLGFHRLQGARGASTAEQGLVVPTEVYDPALHPGGAPSWFACRAPARAAHYEVHDDNAFVMNGVAGHAGAEAGDRPREPGRHARRSRAEGGHARQCRQHQRRPAHDRGGTLQAHQCAHRGEQRAEAAGGGPEQRVRHEPPGVIPRLGGRGAMRARRCRVPAADEHDERRAHPDAVRGAAEQAEHQERRQIERRGEGAVHVGHDW